MKRTKPLTNKKKFSKIKQWECAFCWGIATGNECATCGRARADTQFAISDFTEKEARIADKVAKIEEEEESIWQALET